MRRSLLRAVLVGPLVAVPLFAQSRAITAADYARAERFLAFNTTNLVSRTGVQPTWLPDGRFTYRVRQPDGSSPLMVVDPVKGTKTSEACGPRCRASKGHVCDCSCGGENHGRDA